MFTMLKREAPWICDATTNAPSTHSFITLLTVRFGLVFAMSIIKGHCEADNYSQSSFMSLATAVLRRCQNSHSSLLAVPLYGQTL